MTTVFELVAYLRPQGKARARVLSSGWAYTPAQTVEAEGAIRLAWLAQHGRSALKAYHTDTPLALEVTAVFERPQSGPRSAKRGGAHTVKPDASNILKLIEDALNRVAWWDDAKITCIRIEKRYVREGEQEHIWIAVREAEDA